MDIKMTAIFHYIRTFFFILSVLLITVILTFTFLPALCSKRFAVYCSIKWAGAVIFLAKHIAGVDYELLNEEIVKANGIIIVSNHCSAWETFFLSYYFKIPVFILKKTLFFVPIVGQFLKIVGMIGITRSGKNKTSREEIAVRVNQALESGKNVIIFPQGTRVPTSQTFNYAKYPFKSGVANFVGKNKVLTISNNSRKCFGKGMFSLKKKGKVSLIFNDILQFQEGASKVEIMSKIQESIESGCRKIKADQN